jgi:hypothetical protein
MARAARRASRPHNVSHGPRQIRESRPLRSGPVPPWTAISLAAADLVDCHRRRRVQPTDAPLRGDPIRAERGTARGRLDTGGPFKTIVADWLSVRAVRCFLLTVATTEPHSLRARASLMQFTVNTLKFSIFEATLPGRIRPPTKNNDQALARELGLWGNAGPDGAGAPPQVAVGDEPLAASVGTELRRQLLVHPTKMSNQAPYTRGR